MTKRTMGDIFQDVATMWWNEWLNQTWRRGLMVKRKSRIPKYYEELEISYYEPIYHPVVAMGEVDRTLETMLEQFFQKYVEFANQDREVARIIREVTGYD